jgi:hypothetical protein
MEMLKMAYDISLITDLNSLNMVNQLMKSTSTNSLNSLLSNVTGTSSLLGTKATNQLSVNLDTLGLITALGSLTEGNPFSVFSTALDAATIESAVTNFATAFNKAVTSLSGSSNSISQQNAESLKALTEANDTAFEAIGITIDDDGKLVVDSETLAEAAKNNPEDIQAAFNDTTFATTVSAKARSAISQALGLTSGAGFLSMYTSSLNSGISGILTSLYSEYL